MGKFQPRDGRISTISWMKFNHEKKNEYIHMIYNVFFICRADTEVLLKFCVMIGWQEPGNSRARKLMRK